MKTWILGLPLIMALAATSAQAASDLTKYNCVSDENGSALFFSQNLNTHTISVARKGYFEAFHIFMEWSKPIGYTNTPDWSPTEEAPATGYQIAFKYTWYNDSNFQMIFEKAPIKGETIRMALSWDDNDGKSVSNHPFTCTVN